MTVIGARTTGGLVKIAVSTGGSNYTSPPSVSFSSVGLVGASAYAVMNGTAVDSVAIVSSGSGATTAPAVTFSGGGGTGAAATATIYSGAMRYLSFFKGRNTDVYGVDGMGRGIRWTGAGTTAVQPIGIHRPFSGPSVTAVTGSVSAVQSIQMVNGGAGYNNVPSVVFTGGSPTSAAQARAVVTNGRVSSVVITNPGAGYSATPSVSFSGGIGSGASFGVGVMGGISRVRVLSSGIGGIADVTLTTGGSGYSGTPTVSFSGGGGTGASAYAITHQMVDGATVTNGGTNYTTPPTISFTGGGGTGAAATCDLAGTAVATVYVSTGGTGYTSAPTIVFSGGGGSGASAAATMNTRVATVVVTTAGSGYTSNPTVAFSGGSPASAASATVAAVTAITAGAAIVWNNTNGLTGQHASLVISPSGRLTSVLLASGGTGCTSTGVTASISGIPATTLFGVDQFFTVSSVTASNTGSGYMAAPVITFQAASNDPTGSGASATCSVNSTGNISAVTLIGGGSYSRPPTAVILDTTAKATATMAKSFNGKYKCCYRFLDDTAEDQGGPIPSSISELKEVDCSAGASSITWPAIPTTGIDARVTAAELWRTTADQSVLLFRVATIQRANFAGTAGVVYTDSWSDRDLADSTRDGYGLMPITLPSGQINARRFEVPPGEMAVGVMFQDRAWYGVDTTGSRPNAILYSEIDEPESVPAENELIVQENTTDPDKLVALIPMGGMMLLAQTCHLYRLTYVAQPVIDAAIVLVSYRGILNSRCWDVLGGVAYIADSNGMYAYDGQQEAPISVPIDNLWRDKVIDFSKSEKFHVRADPSSQVVRFYYSRVGDSAPAQGNGEMVGVRALCYCVSTKAWWEETYPAAVTAACRLPIQGANQVVVGTAWGSICKPYAGSDNGWNAGGTGSSTIPLTLRTGALALSNENSNRSITLLYTPTTAAWDLTLNLAYNNAASAKANAVYSDRGTGFIVTTDGATPGAHLDLSKDRSSLGEASGIATAYYSGRVDPRSAGADRHVSVILDSTAGAQRPVIHTMEVDGVQ